jgi:hypothetical protein
MPERLKISRRDFLNGIAPEEQLAHGWVPNETGEEE